MRNLTVLTPVYDDWESLQLLLPRIDSALSAANLQAEVLVVDDGSQQAMDEAAIRSVGFRVINRVRILELSRNCGHQRAIALGLAFLEAENSSTAVVVMDSDGEDSPEDIPCLVNAANNQKKVIFAQREKRSEGLVFKFFYFIYRKLFAMLIGQKVQFGNFSAIPESLLRRVVSVSEIWNHYAIGVLHAKIPYSSVPTHRERRLAGEPKMNFVSLVIHGMSAIAVYGDVLGVRALIITIGGALLFALLAAVAIAIRLFTDLAIPGWATYVVALAFSLSLQLITLSLFFVFIILQNRNSPSFLPRREYEYFINDTRVVYNAHE
jgi:polyisoprenyl-phosphate glycosyltransferase